MDSPSLLEVLDAESCGADETKTEADYLQCNSLFQVETCLRLVPRSGSGDTYRAILSSSLDAVAVAVEHQLMLFSTGNWQLLLKLNFDSTVDCVAFGEDGSVLVVGERTGAVSAICPKTGKRLASRQLETICADDNSPLLKSLKFGGDAASRMVVLSSHGHLHVIDGMQTGQFKLNVVDMTEAASCLTVMSDGDIVTCNADSSVNRVSNCDGEFNVVSSCLMLSGQAVKCAVLPCSSYLLVLDSDGQLTLWNVDRFVAISMLDCSAVEDFVLVDRPVESPNCCVTIAALQKGDTSSYVTVFSLPRTEPIFTVAVCPRSLLFPSSVSSDRIYLLEPSSNSASGWQIRCLAETDPHTRLRRLLVKHLFSEAESFAEKFKLDVEFVYRECVEHLITKLPSAPVDDVDELLWQLTRCLSRLGDVNFVVDCCINAPLLRLSATNELLNLAHARLENCSSVELKASIRTRLWETMRRFSAFQAIYGAGDNNIERWRHFVSVDMYSELRHWLTTGRLDVVSSLCCRFADVLSNKLIANLDETLASIPDEVAVSALCRWLARDVVPLLFENRDESVINALASWIERRAYSMEVTEKQSWPLNAIRLCEVLSTETESMLFKNSTWERYASLEVMQPVQQTDLQAARQSENALIRLGMLHCDLLQITELRDKYSCSLSLAQFRSETIQSIAFRLLDRVVAVELVSAAILDVVCPYAAQNRLDLDELLLSYVKELVHRCDCGSMHISAVWESKAVEILNSITSRALCESALMSILSAAKFPWSDGVSDAVETALAKNPSHAGLKRECQLSSLRQILIGYGLQKFNFADAERAEDLAYHLLVKDRETAVADALAVTEVYSNVTPIDVYLFRCYFLAERDRCCEMVQLLRGITVQPLLDIVCERFVRRCSIDLSNPVSPFRRQYGSAACRIRLLFTSLSPECAAELQRQLSRLEAVYRLDAEFGQFISVSDYSSTAARCQFYDWCVESSLGQEEGGASAANPVVEVVCKPVTKGRRRRFAQLLNLSGYAAVTEAVCAARDGNIRAAVQLLAEIAANSAPEKVGDVLRILAALCESVKNGSLATAEDLSVMHEVACNLALAVSPDMLHGCLRIVRSTSLALDVASQCSNEIPLPTSRDVDMHKRSIFDDCLFDEDCGGLEMDLQCALPPTFEFLAATLPYVSSVFPPPNAVLRQSVVSAAGKAVQQLAANNRTRIALGYIQEVAVLVGDEWEVDRWNMFTLATLEQCVSQRRADHRLALTAALSLPEPLAQSNLQRLARSARVQYKKALAIARVGLAFAQLTNNAAGVEMAQRAVTEADWGYRLAKVKVSFHECFGPGADKRALMPKLAANASVPVADVVQYCQDFGLDVSDCMCIYLRCLLLPSRESVSDDPVVPFSEIRQRAEDSCGHVIQNCIVVSLRGIFENVSSYDYDRLEFVLDQLMSVDRLLSVVDSGDVTQHLGPSVIATNKQLLNCLRNYRRVSPPSQDELLSGDDKVGDRLPFHVLTRKEQHWPLITAELNANTVEQWIQMAKILRIHTDHIYATAVRNMVRSHIEERPSSKTLWSESSIDTDLMDRVNGLLSRVTNLELAVVCVSWIAHELPPSAEKVVAYSWCVSLQEKYVASCPDDKRSEAKTCLEKMKFYSRKTAIEQVLHTSGLAEPNLLALTGGPARLIFQLYEHPSVVEKVRRYNFLTASSAEALTGMPDVHAAADRIAAIGSVNVDKVRGTLLDQWLFCHDTQQLESADVTMVGEDLMQAGGGLQDDLEASDTDLLRAAYLLQHPGTSKEDGMTKLIDYIRAADADSPSTSRQLRAVRCLFMVSDVAAVRQFWDQDWSRYLASLYYTSELRRLRVLSATSACSFDTADKSSLVRALCRCREDAAVPLAASLAADFHVSDPKLWSAIIRRLSPSTAAAIDRPLPCRGPEITDAVGATVLGWLKSHSVDLATAITVCLLLDRCPTCINEDVLRRCAEEFGRHNLLLCATTCLSMLPGERGLTELLECVENDSSSVMSGVNAELAEFASRGRVLPSARRILERLGCTDQAAV